MKFTLDIIKKMAKVNTTDLNSQHELSYDTGVHCTKCTLWTMKSNNTGLLELYRQKTNLNKQTNKQINK